MTGSRIAVAVAVALGVVGLAVPASSFAATSQPAWSYHVTSAGGSVALQYSGASGGGLDSVTFHGNALGASDTLHARARYRDQTSQGCGPITRTKSQTFRGPSFSVQGTNVVVTWQLPLPNPAYCGGANASAVTRQLHGEIFSETIPLARFTCFTMSLQLFGSATVPDGDTMGRLTYQVTVVLRRPPPVIKVSV